MRNPSGISAGVPAPFRNLNPLRDYLVRLELAVVTPSFDTARSYQTYDENIFSPVVNVRLSLDRTSYEWCVLHDGVTDGINLFRRSEQIRGSAGLALQFLCARIADAGAFPTKASHRAFKLLDNATLRLFGHDKVWLRAVRRRMSMQLLNVWAQEEVWHESYATGSHDEILQNVEIGWDLFGPPFRSARRAKRIARRSPDRVF